MSKLRHLADFVVERREVTGAAERRADARYPSHGVACRIGWWRGGAPRVVPAEVADIGFGGAALRARHVPPVASRAWIYLAAAGPRRWIEVSVARVALAGRLRALLGLPHEVGVRFLEPCSWESLRAALYGAGGATDDGAPPPPLPR